MVKSPSSDIFIILMRAPELLAEVAVRPPAGGHAMSKGHAYSQCPATSTTQCCPSSSCRRATSGTSYWGTTTWNPERSSCTADPSVNNMSKPQNPTGSRTRGWIDRPGICARAVNFINHGCDSVRPFFWHPPFAPVSTHPSTVQLSLRTRPRAHLSNNQMSDNV